MKSKRFLIISILAFTVILTTCKKEPEAPEGGNKIEFGQTSITDLSYRDAKATTTVSDLGGNIILQHGHCWSTSPDPDISANHTSLGNLNDPAPFISEIENLQPGTKYYIKSYFSFSNSTIYGEQKELETFSLATPEVNTDSITGIKFNKVTVFGNVSDNGGTEITQQGFCWNKTGNPTLDNNLGVTNESTGDVNFSSTISSLEELTEYYIVAYATNETGVSYGVTKSFFTLELTPPTVTTSNISYIDVTSAQGGGNVTNNGNGTVSARGVCWNTTGNPTLENNLDFTTDGTGTGSFTSTLTGLQEGENYFVAAYATNEEETNYGSEKTYTHTILPCGELTINYGNQTYNTVEIGNQCWFKENLNIGTRIDGSQEQTNDQTIEKYCYDDVEANCDEYGGLYQWDEMMQYVTTEGTQGICPDGWHLPTDDEWTTLTDFLGGASVAGDKMKSQSGWNNNGNGTNSSGFSALPAGYRYTDGGFYYLGNVAYFWSSTEGDTTSAWNRVLGSENPDLGRYDSNKEDGFSGRCLQD